METPPYKVRAQFGAFAFEAEGDKDTVMEQYRMFLDALKATSAAVPLPKSTPPQSVPVTQVESLERGIDLPAPDSGGISPELLERAYSRERGVISLRVIPPGKTGAADALLLLLLGYHVLKGEHDVYGTQLMKAARISGLPIDRIDRVISDHRGLFIRGGARRGARYALNNQGKVRAKAILEGIFE